MKLLLYTIILLSTLFLECNASHNYFTIQKRNYVDSLNKVVEIVKSENLPSNELILFCIPTTQEEASVFFKLDYNKEEQYNMVFRKLNDMWENKCSNNETLFLIRYLEYSEFVDGYFAEDYFISINKIYKAIGSTLCEKLNECSENKIKRIRLYLTEQKYCSN
jgi:hypothetical protein